MSRRTSDPIWDPTEHAPEGGRPVPWVARWSREIGDEHVTTMTIDALDHELTIQAYPESLHGQGEPDYGAVDTYRGIRCFNEGRCQVCGAEVEDPFTIINASHPISHLGAKREEIIDVMKDLIDDPIPVYDMPVCDECRPMSLRHCPNVNDRLTVVRISGPFIINGAMMGPPGKAEDTPVHEEAMTYEYEAGHVVKQLIVVATLTGVE